MEIILANEAYFLLLLRKQKQVLEKQYNNGKQLHLENRKLIKYIAICYDALGQAYDLINPEEAEKYF